MLITHLAGYNLVELQENINKLERMFEDLQEMVIRLLQLRQVEIELVIHKFTTLPAAEQSEHELFFLFTIGTVAYLC